MHAVSKSPVLAANDFESNENALISFAQTEYWMQQYPSCLLMQAVTLKSGEKKNFLS